MPKPRLLGFIFAEGRASVTYLVGDAPKVAAHRLPRDEELLLRGLDAALPTGAAPFGPLAGAGLIVTKNMGAGLASVHRVGEWIVLCEPGLGREWGEDEMSDEEARTQEKLERDVAAWSPIGADTLGEFEVASGKLAILYSWQDGACLEAPMAALDEEDDEEESPWSVAEGDMGFGIGIVLAVTPGRHVLMSREVDMNGEDAVLLGISAVPAGR